MSVISIVRQMYERRLKIKIGGCGGWGAGHFEILFPEGPSGKDIKKGAPNQGPFYKPPSSST